ncbi:DUF2530 domain-containing protein [Cellulomonas sp. URHB0016]
MALRSLALRTPPAPVPVDLGRVMLVGSAVWLVALGVSTLLALVGAVSWMLTWVCVAGLVTGMFGWDWARRHGATAAAGTGPSD